MLGALTDAVAALVASSAGYLATESRFLDGTIVGTTIAALGVAVITGLTRLEQTVSTARASTPGRRTRESTLDYSTIVGTTIAPNSVSVIANFRRLDDSIAALDARNAVGRALPVWLDTAAV